jgi:RHS repeat-associated protein
VEVESPFRLLGQYADKETGLCCTRYRYFDAETGRWLSTDPLGLGGGPNLLAWDRSPVLTTDPLGLSTDAPVLATQPADAPYRDVLIAMSKPSAKEYLLRVDRYVNPGHHDPSGGGPNPYNPAKSVLPDNHVALFNSSVPVRDPQSGKVTRWAKEGEGKNAVFHRFQEEANGIFHWNGSTRGRTKSGIPRELPMNQVPNCMRK